MTFESHAIVELMGHARIAGKVSEQVIGGVAMLRVDVPETSVQSAFTKFYSAGAVYAITPVDETIAHQAAEQFQERPIQEWILPLSAPVLIEKIEEDDPRFFDGSIEFPDPDDIPF